MLTLPQIEIMQADLPHTLYLKKGEKKVDDNDPAFAMQKEADARVKERREKEGYTINEIFAGAADGE